MVDHLDAAKNMLAIESVYLSYSSSQRNTEANYSDLHAKEYHRQTFSGVIGCFFGKAANSLILPLKRESIR